MDIVSYILSKKYTDKALEGAGALKGANCTIKSIEPINGGNRVTFEWTENDGTVETDTMDVMDGDVGEGVPTGGTTGQVLVKKSDSDYDTEWVDAPRYNVLDYGLKGDRTTDNTEALRTLIATIPNGSVIFFPVGTYVITEGIEINKDVTFLGENEEMQTAGTAPNRIHDPMSIIKYGGNTANVTMFTKASGYYDVNFVNLTLDGGNSYDVTDNWTGTFTTLPFYNQLETTNLAGINGLDVSILSPGIVKNCMFWGFSGYGVKIAQHKYVEHCGFYKCKKGIVTIFSDSLLHDLWFCKSGTAIYMLPRENDHFASINLSDVWADQLIDHLVEADSTVTSAQIITSNIWVDSVGKSAFYLPEAVVSRAHIQGTFGRIGMDYAGIADADRTSALAQYTDFLACGRLIYSTLELNISNVTIGKGSNANGECFSRLITTYKANHHNEHNKIICNSFPVARLYDSNTQPQYAYFADTEYNGTDGNVLIYTGSTYVNGFFTYTNNPVGRCVAPSKDFLVYNRLAKKLYRSTAGDDNTAWAEVDLGVIPHYSTMPSTADLFALPNNTVFETDGYWTQTDGHGGKYLITTNAWLVGGMLKITDGTTTKYLVALDNDGNALMTYVDPTRYGVRAIAGLNGNLTLENTYATANSDIISRLTNTHMNATIKFPKGYYVFESPLNFTNRQYSVAGTGLPVTKTTALSLADYEIGTVLCFPFLTNGQTAISTAGNSTIENLAIYGNKNTYNFVIDRTKLTTAPNEVITETIAENEGTQIQCKAINKDGGGQIHNVFIFNFYTGITCQGNTFIKNFYARQVHYGINCANDTKMEGIGGFNVHTLIRIRGSLCSVLHERVDSCVHALEIVNGSSHTITDVDGDWCTDSLIAIGDGTTYGTVSSVVFDGVHGRCNTLKAYDSTQQTTPLDVRTLPSIDGYGVIRVYNNVNFSDSRIVVNAHGGANPIDGTSTYLTPDILFTFSSPSDKTLDNITFVLAKGIYDIGDILRVIQTRSGFSARVDDSSGTYFIEGTTVKDSVDPATDIDFTTVLGGN